MKFSTGGLTLINFEGLSTHDFTQLEDWVKDENGNPNSLWTLEPPEGEIYLFTDTKVALSVSVVLTSSIFVEFWIPGVPTPVRQVEYKGRRDLTIRAEDVKFVNHECEAQNDLSESFHLYSINFAEEVVLWGSAGLDDGVLRTYGDENRPKVGSMTMRIGDNQPFPGQMAKCRYNIDRYLDTTPSF